MPSLQDPLGTKAVESFGVLTRVDARKRNVLTHFRFQCQWKHVDDLEVHARLVGRALLLSMLLANRLADVRPGRKCMLFYTVEVWRLQSDRSPMHVEFPWRQIVDTRVGTTPSVQSNHRQRTRVLVYASRASYRENFTDRPLECCAMQFLFQLSQER